MDYWRADHQVGKKLNPIILKNFRLPWGLLVTFLYLLLLVQLTAPVIHFSFLGTKSQPPIWMLFREWSYWGIILGMGLTQYLFLSVPIRMERNKRVGTLPVFWTICTSGLMMAFLAVAAYFTLHEFLTQTSLGGNKKFWRLYFPLALGLGFWFFWGIIFFKSRPVINTENPSPSETLTPASIREMSTAIETWISRLSRFLLAGSIVELLIAVPAHILVRGKNYCCAGISTFFGISTGIAVLLFSFGPAVFFLFLHRAKKLKPKAP